MLGGSPIGGAPIGGEAWVYVPHWRALLATAERLYTDKHYGAAVIVAASACEVIVESAMSKGFKAKNVPELEEPVTDFLFSCSLVSGKSQKLYNVLTGDTFNEKSPHWDGYKKLFTHRNQAAHAGVAISPADVQADIESARQFVEHVERHNGFK